MSKTISQLAVLGLLLRLAPLHGAESPARFLGANACASSGCHGGGGPRQNQFLIWSLKDFHSHRPVATLGSARSRQIGEALQMAEPAREPRCTTCHAPLEEVPEARRGPGFQTAEGVSCESCHGAAEGWLRTHTRTDLTRADRTAAGLRDLRDLYVRANTCAACHQVVSRALLQAGHPELQFELDGQSVAEPAHWATRTSAPPAQVWFVGQAVALREMSWQLRTESGPDAKLAARWGALVWLLQKLDGWQPQWPTLAKIPAQPTPEALQLAHVTSDALARLGAELTWNDELTRAALARLAHSAADFSVPGQPGEAAARRAERLVLALDRLLGANHSAAESPLNLLFRQAQSVPDFAPVQFAATLEQLASALDRKP